MPTTFADGLRELADWFEEHPEVEEPPLHVLLYCNEPEQFAATVRALSNGGRAEKRPDDSWFNVDRAFGPISVQAYIERGSVCRKIVTGVEQVPETVTPAHDREIVEWECDEPILASLPKSEAVA